MASRGIPNFQNGRKKGLTFLTSGSRWSKNSLTFLYTLKNMRTYSQENQTNINYNPS